MKQRSNEKRTAAISIRVTPSDKKKARTKAAEEGFTLSTRMAQLLYDYISR